MNVFERLNSVNVNDRTEKKNGLTYLSWAWAWAEVKKAFPGATYTVYERPDGVIYWTDGRTCWVKTGVTIEGLEHIEYLPVMDFRNNSIPADKVTSTDVNKAIQRSLTKAAARHGLGLYIYAGEDLPECEQEKPEPPKQTNFDRAIEFCKGRQIDTRRFGELVRAAKSQGVVPDKQVNEMTEPEFLQLMAYVEVQLGG